MAINKKVQFLRNNSIYTGATGVAARTAAIAGMRSIATGSTTSGEIVDGQAILARYNTVGSASTGDVQTIYGIVHKGVNSKTGVTIYESSELLWAAIDANASTSTTISAGTGLSGGDQLSAETITISHATVNRTDNTPIDPTDISNGGSFTAVTNVGSNTLGHVTGVTKTVFNLPSISDTAVTQSAMGSLDTGAYPILTKMDTSNSAVTSGAFFANDVTIDKSGNLSAKTSVKSATISGTSVYGPTISGGSVTASGNVRGGNVSAGTITAATDLRAGNISAATISAATHVKSATISGTNVYGPTISGGSVTATGDVRGGNVSAATISAATHVKSATISGGSLTASGNIRGGNVSADTISAATHVKSATISGTNVYGPTISGGSVTASGTVKGATVSAGSYSNLPTASSERDGVVKVVETTGTTSGSTVMSQKAVTDAITSALADVADALVYKGTVSGTATSPGASLPAAEKGDVYKVAQSGYVAGVKVEVGDMFICNTDTASGTASTNWDVIQTNVDMANYVQTARTVTAGTGLSGGGNLGSDVTIRHKTVTVNTLTDTDQTQIGTARTFTAVTGITDDGMGHMSSIKKAIFKLPDDVDTAVTQSAMGSLDTGAYPILTKLDTTNNAVTGGAFFASDLTVDRSGNLSAKTSVKSATISGTSVYGPTISGGSVTASGNVRGGNVSAGTITAATDLRAGNVSAGTISAATHVKSATISGTSVYGPTISGGSLTVTGTVTAKDVTASTSVKSPSISGTSVYGPTISGTNITAANLVTASGFSATAAASTASTDINASILLSNGKNTNIIDCGTY